MGKTPSVIVLQVRHQGQLVFDEAYSMFDPEASASEEVARPAPASALSDLASVIKQSTTTAFMRPVEAERVRLYRTVAEVIPKFTSMRPTGDADEPSPSNSRG
ncbi:MAG: serine hydrolase [Anaerolineae bacterium]|nr:serine hydrolase [Anaerolineae bacterium]MDW8099321.1 serine hydrolase [Anaerolineae bacterium]